MNISAVLLAGGESRRMGQDKAALLFRGKRLWQTQVELLRTLQPQEIFISARTHLDWRPVDIEFVPDQQPSRGPLSGIAAALSRITTGHLLALAIDMPFMTAKYLQSLCQRVQSHHGALPLIGDRAEPLAAIYPRDAYVDFVDALSGHDFSLQSLARKLITTRKVLPIRVSKEEEQFFRNLNEPQDLECH